MDSRSCCRNYDEWGRLLPTSGDSAGFNNADRARWKGALWMGPELDLYYMPNRWYEPRTGRFLSEDPIGLQGGINQYVFAAGDPINGRDPSGLYMDFPDNTGFAGCFGASAEARNEAWAGLVDLYHALLTLSYEEYERAWERLQQSGAFRQLSAVWGNQIFDSRKLDINELEDVVRAIRGLELLLRDAPSTADNLRAWIGLTNILGNGRIGFRSTLIGASGEAYYGRGGPFIALGAQFWTSPASQTFFLAHEFGHIWYRTRDNAIADAFACRATGQRRYVLAGAGC